MIDNKDVQIESTEISYKRGEKRNLLWKMVLLAILTALAVGIIANRATRLPASQLVANKSALSNAANERYALTTEGLRGQGHGEVLLVPEKGNYRLSVKVVEPGIATLVKGVLGSEMLEMQTSKDYMVKGVGVEIIKSVRSADGVKVTRTLVQDDKGTFVKIRPGSVYHAFLLPYIVGFANREALPKQVTCFDPRSKKVLIFRLSSKHQSNGGDELIFTADGASMRAVYGSSNAGNCIPEEVEYKTGEKRVLLLRCLEN